MTDHNDTQNINPELLKDRRFQNLLGKAATHQRKFRPSETKTLEKDDLLMKTLLERTQTCWLALKNARQSGMTMQEAQELAFPIILLPDERDESVPQQ
jgi:hypothetical protein